MSQGAVSAYGSEPLCARCGYEYPAHTHDATGQCQLCQVQSPLKVAAYHIGKPMFPIGPDGRQGFLNAEQAGLTRDQRLFVALNYFHEEFCQTEFRTALAISDGASFVDFLEGLEVLGASQALETISLAHVLTFGVPRPPAGGWTYEQVLTSDKLSPAVQNDLLTTYAADPDKIEERLTAFAIETHLMRETSPYRGSVA